MAITGGVEFVKRTDDDNRSLKDRLDAQNNVIDLKGKVTDLDLSTTTNENEDAINASVERDFDAFMIKNEAKVKALFNGGTYDKDNIKQILQNDFKAYLNDPTNKSELSTYLDQRKNAETTALIAKTTFELDRLSESIQLYFLKKNINNGGSGNGGNPGNGNGSGGNGNPGGYVDQDKKRNSFDGNLSDAVQFQNQSEDVSTQYAAESYLGGVEEEDISDGDDKEALRKLIKGTIGGKTNKALDIVDVDYKPDGADKKALGMMLRVLKRIGKDKGDKLDAKDIAKAFETIVNAYNKDPKTFGFEKKWRKDKLEKSKVTKDIYKLGSLYTIVRNNVAGFPYLERVMGLFVQEYTREKVPSTGKSIVEIYNEHNDMLINPDITLVSRKGAAIRALDQIKDKGQIRKLLKLADGVDMTRLLSLIDDNPKLGNTDGGYGNIPWGDGKKSFHLSDKEEKVLDLYRKNRGDGEFIKIFEGLGAGMTIQEIANAGKIILIPDGNEKEDENKFVSRLCDFDFNGRTDFGDHGMTKGLQLKNIYRETQAILLGTGNTETQILKNILDYCKNMAKQLGLSTFEKNIDGQLTNPKGISFASFLNFVNISGNAPLLKFIQKTLAESPVPAANIFQSGMNAYQDYYNNSLDNIPNERRKKLEKHFADKGLNLDDSPATKEGIIQAANSFLMTQMSGAGMGASVNIGGMVNASNPALDYFLSGLDISFGIGVAKTSDDAQTGIFGIQLSRNKAWKVGHTTSIYAGVSTGGSFAEGFIPMWSMGAGAGIEQQVNKKQLEKKLDARSAKKFTLGANVTVYACTVPSRGVQLGYSSDKMEGVETQYNKIKSSAKRIAFQSINAIKNIKNDEPAALAAISSVLQKEFGKSSEDALHQSAFNIYRGLTAFGLAPEDFDKPAKIDQVSALLGEFYALSWKNAAVTGLKGRHFDKASIGVQFFADFFPVPSVCIQIAKYKNFYYEDTPESRAALQQRQAIGDGNQFISETISDNATYTINSMLEVPFKNKKMELGLTVDTKKEGQVPDIEFNATDQTLSIPFSLRERGIINVNIDPVLKGKMQVTSDKKGNKYLIVPAQIPLCLFTASAGTEVASLLTLGDNKADGGKKTVDKKGIVTFEDLVLRSGNSIPGDWLLKKGEKITPIFEKITKIEDVNALINKLNVDKFKDFPLRSAEKSKEKGKEKQTVFTVLSPITGQLQHKVSCPNGELQTNGNTITLVPETGLLKVNYNTTKKQYEFIYEAQPTDKLQIAYKIDNLTAAENDPTNWIDIGKPIEFIGTEKLFEFNDNTPLKEAYDIIEKNKSKINNKERGNANFSLFMKNLWTVLDNDNLNEKELDAATAALLKIIDVNSDLGKFVDKIQKGKDYETLAYVLDRMKQVFAMEQYSSSLTGLRGTRRDRFHEILSPSKDKLPTILDRTLIEKKGDITEPFNETHVTEYNNLIGYTAFYRKEGSPAWSMTAPGTTTVYKDSKGKEFISDALDDKNGNKLTTARDWFIGNLREQKYEKDLLLKAVQAHIPVEYQKQVTSDNIVDFLKTGELIVAIDNGTKKYKLTLDTSYHFYLLGECGNESVGVKIKGLSIKQFIPKGNGDASVGDVPYSYDNPDMGWYLNNGQTTNVQFANKQKIGLGYSGGVSIPKQKPVDTPIDRGSTGADPDIIDYGNTGPS